MKYHREYEIGWYGLAQGPHIFKYVINDQALEKLGYSKDGFDSIDVEVTLTFDKQSNFFLLKFDVDGIVSVPCDRCGDVFEMSLWDEFHLVIKLKDLSAENSNHEDHDDGDVVFIPRSETVLNVSEWLYEFVMLSIPIQRIHPLNDQNERNCNVETLKILDKMSAVKETTASIWRDLDKFKK